MYPLPFSMKKISLLINLYIYNIVNHIFHVQKDKIFFIRYFKEYYVDDRFVPRAQSHLNNLSYASPPHDEEARHSTIKKNALILCMQHNAQERIHPLPA